MPTKLRALDDRLLGPRHDRGTREAPRGDDGEVYPDEPTGPVESTPRRERRPAGDVVREVLGVVWTVSRYVFLALAAIVVVGIVLTLAPTNEDNSLVSAGLSAAEWATGPFRDVFTPDGENLQVLLNYGLAAVVYLVAASLVQRLPGKRGATG
ncbi:MAG: hypothetical protein ACLGIG_02805 [Actinomycetes bacterium]